jgi:hypothetical protein
MNRFCIGVVVVLVLTVGSSTAHAGKGAKKGEHHHRGTVVAVEENGGHGHITVKVHHQHKKTVNAAGSKLEKFHISASTKFELVSKQEHRPATVAAVHVGEHVLILAHEHHADMVEIAHHHHKPKKGKK